MMSYLHYTSPEAIKRKVELDWGTEDTEYLQKVELHSEGALNEARPDIIIYNAGTDILDGDPLGGLCISPQVPDPPSHKKPRITLEFASPRTVQTVSDFKLESCSLSLLRGSVPLMLYHISCSVVNGAYCT